MPDLQQVGLHLEELSLALADKLWKGKREEKLERAVVEVIASQQQINHWDILGNLYRT